MSRFIAIGDASSTDTPPADGNVVDIRIVALVLVLTVVSLALVAVVYCCAMHRNGKRGPTAFPQLNANRMYYDDDEQLVDTPRYNVDGTPSAVYRSRTQSLCQRGMQQQYSANQFEHTSGRQLTCFGELRTILRLVEGY